MLYNIFSKYLTIIFIKKIGRKNSEKNHENFNLFTIRINEEDPIVRCSAVLIKAENSLGNDDEIISNNIQLEWVKKSGFMVWQSD